MRSAIIGNGFIAQKHQEAIKQMGWEYLGAYDVVPDRSIITLDKVLEADYIHVCTPNVFHHQLPKISPEQRFIIEKPVAINSNLVPNIPDAMVCYQRRFDEKAILAKELCKEEKPIMIIANIFVPRDNFYWECWRGDKSMSGGGALMNIGIHYLDLLQWWLGDKYNIEDAKVTKFYRAIDEAAYIKFDFDGVSVTFDLNARHNRRKTELIIFWKDKTFVYNQESATHYDLFKGFEKGNFVNPEEAKKSLKMVEEIYAKSISLDPNR